MSTRSQFICSNASQGFSLVALRAIKGEYGLAVFANASCVPIAILLYVTWRPKLTDKIRVYITSWTGFSFVEGTIYNMMVDDIPSFHNDHGEVIPPDASCDL